MSYKKAFQLFTKQNALKKNAVKLCEHDPKFIDNFAKEKAEQERLLKNKTKHSHKTREDWTITIYKLPDSEMYGKKYVAEARNENHLIQNFGLYHWKDNPNHVYSDMCNVVDEYINKEKKLISFLQDYKVFQPLYLMLLYLSGWDNHNEFLSINSDERGKETFTGVQSWIGLDFEILNFLEKEKLIEQPQRGDKNYKKVTYIELTKKGIKMARDFLKQTNLEGVDLLLSQRDYHEEYLNHQTRLDIRREEE
jgi:hypothetical protein